MKRSTRRILEQERARKGKIVSRRLQLRGRRWPWQAGGALLVLLALLLSWRIESAAATYQAALQAVAGTRAGVIDLGRDARPSARLQGELVRVVGTPQVVEAPLDTGFNQSALALRLHREVAMFQWQQVDVGYPLYELEWQDGRVDSAAFAQPRGHENPQPPVAALDLPAPRVRLDGFVLAPALTARIPGRVPQPVRAAALPGNLAATFTPYHGALYSGDPRHPRLGDVRIRWSVVPPQQVTVLARVDHGELLPAPNASVQLGDRSLGDLLPQLPPRPLYTWPTRLLAWLLAAAGLAALRHRQGGGIDVVQAALGAAVLLLLPAVPAWMRVGTPDVLVPVLALPVLVAVLVMWRRRARRAA